MAGRNWAEVGQKWKDRSNTQSAQKAWIDGVNRQVGSPTQKAAAAIPKYVQNVMAAVESGRMAQRLLAVTDGEYKEACNQKQGNYLRGVVAGSPKYTAYITAVGPMIEAAADAVNRMPKLTIEDSKAKSAAMIDAMHALKGRWRGR